MSILFGARVVGEGDVGDESLGEFLIRTQANEKYLHGRIKELADRVKSLETVMESMDKSCDVPHQT